MCARACKKPAGPIQMEIKAQGSAWKLRIISKSSRVNRISCSSVRGPTPATACFHTPVKQCITGILLEARQHVNAKQIANRFQGDAKS